MEIKQYSALIDFEQNDPIAYVDFEYDDFITRGMVKQLEFYILQNPYIDDVLSIYVLQNNNAFEKRVLEITVLHHAEDDETIDTILTKATTYFASNTFLFTKPRGMRC